MNVELVQRAARRAAARLHRNGTLDLEELEGAARLAVVEALTADPELAPAIVYRIAACRVVDVIRAELGRSTGSTRCTVPRVVLRALAAPWLHAQRFVDPETAAVAAEVLEAAAAARVDVVRLADGLGAIGSGSDLGTSLERDAGRIRYRLLERQRDRARLELER